MHTEGHTETRELSEDELDLVSGGWLRSFTGSSALDGVLAAAAAAVVPRGVVMGGRGPQDVQAP